MFGYGNQTLFWRNGETDGETRVGGEYENHVGPCEAVGGNSPNSQIT